MKYKVVVLMEGKVVNEMFADENKLLDILYNVYNNIKQGKKVYKIKVEIIP